MQGRVIAAYGRHYLVKLNDESVRQSYTKGKKTGVCVGDYVTVALHGKEEARIENILERKNLLYRSDDMRSKQFAANVDQLLIVLAVEPNFSEDLLGRALTCAWSVAITPTIVLNKIDLHLAYPQARQRLSLYEQFGVRIIEVSTLHPHDLQQKMMPLLGQKTNLLLGQSAMGKSSILNVLFPDAQAHTQDYSMALRAGKHTTTTTHLYEMNNIDAAIIDSPGFQSFGLRHLKQGEIEQGFPEFSRYIPHCRFYNCTHLHEPGCHVLQALRNGEISPTRYALYTRIQQECNAPEKY